MMHGHTYIKLVIIVWSIHDARSEKH